MALVFVASAVHDKKPSASKKFKWEVNIPYDKSQRSRVGPSSPIAKETLRVPASIAKSSASKRQVTPSVSRKFKWDVNIPYGIASEPSSQASYQLNLFLNLAELRPFQYSLKYKQKSVFYLLLILSIIPTGSTFKSHRKKG